MVMSTTAVVPTAAMMMIIAVATVPMPIAVVSPIIVFIIDINPPIPTRSIIVSIIGTIVIVVIVGLRRWRSPSAYIYLNSSMARSKNWKN